MSRLAPSRRSYGLLQPPVHKYSIRVSSPSSLPLLESLPGVSPPAVSLSARFALSLSSTDGVRAKEQLPPEQLGSFQPSPPEQSVSFKPETRSDVNTSFNPDPSSLPMTSQPGTGPPPQMAPPISPSNASSPNLFDSDNSQVGLIGMTLAGLAIISLVAFIFAIIRKNKNKHADLFVGHYAPRDFSMKLDDHFRRERDMVNYSPYSRPKPLKSPPSNGSGYVGYGGNGFHSGLADSGAIGNSKSHSGLVDSGATGNSRFHSSPADSAARGNSRVHSGRTESGAIGNSKVHSGPLDSGAIGNSKFHSGPLDSGAIGTLKWFTYDELMETTHGFSKQNFLGEGGFGSVYKGQLPDGKEVAVKLLKVGSGQGEREFKAEVEIISRVHHRHLVSLVGYCIAEHHRLLVYEFVPNNTLEHHLHGKGMPVLEWSKRVKIAIGAAKGLAYLHEDCRLHSYDMNQRIVVKSQVADFGLAKPSTDGHTHISTRVMGTFGYLAPEYASSGKLTDRSDVFSFGVVLLELVTGRKPVDSSQPFGEESLVDWARPLLIQALESGDLGELLDSRLGNRYVESEVITMIEIASVCVCHSAPKRPRMVQVVRALDSEGSISDLSKRMKSGSGYYSSGQLSTDSQRARQMGAVSGRFSPANGSSTSRENEQMSAFSGQSPLRAQYPKRGLYGYDYGPSGDFQSRETPSREYHSRERPHRPPNAWKGNHGSDFGINHTQSGEHDIRRMLPRPQNSRRGSDCSSGHGPSGEYDRRSSEYAGEYLSKELPRRPQSPMRDNQSALSENPGRIDLEAWPGSDRNSRGLHANNFMSGRYNRR
ncbi:hypothetical protein MRB53_018640 [Persea americana]|uniref:Uncharacterized protein n=1 Tax=Persea americana TaxID=3435 RepID=A0ACC2M9D9_PERAE|nr:hypothetical protein MRB53_018640 [Persea americana]